MNKKTIASTTDNTILKLKVLAKKKEGVRNKLVVTAKQLAILAKEKEGIRRKLEITARKLATTAEEKEDVRSRLAATAKKLAVTAKEKEGVRGKLVITARQLAVVAEEKENVRNKLAVTARKLATTAEEKEDVRRRLVVTAKNLDSKAKQLAKTAKEKESVRSKLAVTAETLRLKAKQLAVTAKEKEEARSKLAITAKQLAVTAKEIELVNNELRSLDLAKDEFVSIASHQLRTPLTALKGYVGMILDGDVGLISDKQREYLTEIKNANDRMINLITALLNVSRVDLGVFVVEPEQINLKEVAESALKELEIKIKDKKLILNVNFEKDLPLISADLNIMRMIFQNLLTNAVKYIPIGGSITLNIKRDGPDAVISVSDTGYGIPANVQSKIFTKMFRADNARVKDPDGTGLGLYIIKATIEKTGGRIWFKSEENKGSTFYVAIPLKGMKKKEGSRRLELK